MYEEVIDFLRLEFYIERTILFEKDEYNQKIQPLEELRVCIKKP